MELTEGFKKYFFNTSWLLSEKIVRMGIQVVVGVVVARYQGPTWYGLLSYATSFTVLFSALTTLGLDSIVVQEVVKYPSKRDELLGSAFVLKLVGSIFCLVLLTAGTLIASNDRLTSVMIIVIGAGYLFQTVTIIDFYFQAKILSKYSVYAGIGQLVVSSIFKLILVLARASLIWFAIGLLLDSIVLASGYLISYRANGLSPLTWRFSRRTSISLLRNSWPLALSTVAVMVYMKMDQVIIKEMLDATDVGYYAVAVRLSESWYFVPMALITSLFPVVISAREVSSELYDRRLQQLYDLLMWSSLLISLVVGFFAEDIVTVLFGERFRAAGPVLAVYIWSGNFVFMGVAIGRWLLVEGLQVLDFLRTALGAIVNVILNILWIPKFGIVGSAYATLVAYFVGSYSILLFFPKGRRNFSFALNSFNPLRLF